MFVASQRRGQHRRCSGDEEHASRPIRVVEQFAVPSGLHDGVEGVECSEAVAHRGEPVEIYLGSNIVWPGLPDTRGRGGLGESSPRELSLG